jgi:RNA recognition motif-containing protein
MASSTVFVSNFPFATTEDELRERFEQFGSVRSVRIIVDRETGRSRGFAFVELASAGDIDGVIEALDGTELKGRRLAVSKARGRAGGESRTGPPPPAHDDDPRARPRDPFRHRIVIDWLEESSSYLASVPDLGVSAQAATIEAAVHQVQARAREAGPPIDDAE